MLQPSIIIHGAEDIASMRPYDADPVGDQYGMRSEDMRLIVWASVSELREMSEKLNDLANEIMMRELAQVVAS